MEISLRYARSCAERAQKSITSITNTNEAAVNHAARATGYANIIASRIAYAADAAVYAADAAAYAAAYAVAAADAASYTNAAACAATYAADAAACAAADAAYTNERLAQANDLRQIYGDINPFA